MSATDPSIPLKSAVVSGIAVAANLPWQQYVVASKNFLSTSTVAAIVDKSKNEWLMRIDKPHLGAMFPHININHKITKIRDPHARIAGAMIPICGTTQSVANTVADWLPTVYTLITVGRLTSAVVKDIEQESFPTQSVETAKTITGELTGALIGGKIGSKIGAVTGGMIANIPGAAVGSILGVVVGSVGGAMAGANAVKDLQLENLIKSN